MAESRRAPFMFSQRLGLLAVKIFCRLILVIVLGFVGPFSPSAFGCTVILDYGYNESQHVLVGRIASHSLDKYDGRTVLGLEIEPVHNFTKNDQELGENYVLYPTGIDSLCQSFYVGPNQYTEKRYKVGSLVAIYGLKTQGNSLGDLAVSSHMVEPIHPLCEDDLYTVPSESDSENGCVAGLFHIHRVLALLPNARKADIDRGLRWLSTSWYTLPYENLVNEYAEPSEVETYMKLRYGEVLDADCAEEPEMWSSMLNEQEREERRKFRRRWSEYCR